MIAGPTSTVLQPLRTIAGAGGGGGNDNLKTDETTSSTTELSFLDEASGTTVPASNGSGATATTRRSSGPTTTAAARPTTTTPGSPGGGSAPPPTSPIGACKAGELSYATSTNKSTYRPNETVDIRMVVRNGSDRPCYAPAACGAPLSASVTNSEGATVWSGSARTTSCGSTGSNTVLVNPHETLGYGSVGSWDQTSGGAHAPVGSYRATAKRGSTTASGATFALRS